MPARASQARTKERTKRATLQRKVCGDGWDACRCACEERSRFPVWVVLSYIVEEDVMQHVERSIQARRVMGMEVVLLIFIALDCSM